MSTDVHMSIEDGFYWARLCVGGDFTKAGEWQILQVSTAHDKQYIWSAGWEVPIPKGDVTWGPRINPPHAELSSQ